jgi:hypothetical protein
VFLVFDVIMVVTIIISSHHLISSHHGDDAIIFSHHHHRRTRRHADGGHELRLGDLGDGRERALGRLQASDENPQPVPLTALQCETHWL